MSDIAEHIRQLLALVLTTHFRCLCTLVSQVKWSGSRLGFLTLSDYSSPFGFSVLNRLALSLRTPATDAHSSSNGLLFVCNCIFTPFPPRTLCVCAFLYTVRLRGVVAAVSSRYRCLPLLRATLCCLRTDFPPRSCRRSIRRAAADDEREFLAFVVGAIMCSRGITERIIGVCCTLATRVVTVERLSKCYRHGDWQLGLGHGIHHSERIEWDR